MLKIREPHPYFDKILGKTSFRGDAAYRKSQFLSVYPYKGVNLVLSTLTHALYVFSNEELSALEDPSAASESVKAQLAAERLIVPDPTDEYALAEQLKTLYLTLNPLNRDFIDNYTILTTTECNARCYYCYEHGIEHVTMSKETALDVAKFISDHHAGRPVTVKWFGGEPLYNQPVIHIILEELRKKNIEFSTQFTSNGYLFDEDTVIKAVKEWNVKKVQITLDGTEEIYNRYKAYIYESDVSPFKRVTDNIGYLLKWGVTVNIRLNMDENNAPDLQKLVNWISKRYEGVTNLHIYVAIIFNKNKTRTLADRERLMQAYADLTSDICAKGLSRYRLNEIPFKLSACMADNPHAVVITPDGNLQRCEHIAPEEIYGNIWDERINEDVYTGWQDLLPPIEECKTCPYSPGCRVAKKCKTFLECTPDERIGKEIQAHDAMRYCYDQYLLKTGSKA